MEFFQTEKGRRYYDYQVPELIKQLKRVADVMENKDAITSSTKDPVININVPDKLGYIPITITRYTPEQAAKINEVVGYDLLSDKGEYVAHVENPIKVIAVLGIMLPNCGTLYISELANGKFYTEAGRDTEFGTLDECIKLLKEEFL